MKLRDYIEVLQQSSFGHTNPVVIEMLSILGQDKLDMEMDEITKESASKLQQRSELIKVKRIFALIQTHNKEKFPYGRDVDEFLNYSVRDDVLIIFFNTWNNYTEEYEDEVIDVPSIWMTLDEQTIEKNVIRWVKLKRLHSQLENTEKDLKTSHQRIVNCEYEIELVREKIQNLEETRLKLLEEIENENRT